MSVLLIALLLAGDNVSPTVDPQAAQAGEATKTEKKVCKVDPAYTGSRMKKKLCLTQVEWAKRDATGVSNERAGRSYTADQ